MKLGIIGLPQSGKTTIFNALTRGNAPTTASAGRFEVHTAVVDVPDEREGTGRRGPLHGLAGALEGLLELLDLELAAAQVDVAVGIGGQAGRTGLSVGAPSEDSPGTYHRCNHDLRGRRSTGMRS